MHRCFRILSAVYLLFLCNQVAARSDGVRPGFCLVVKWDNQSVDEEIYGTVIKNLPSGLKVIENGNIQEVGIIEIFIARKGDSIPGSWYSNGKTSNAWYSKWQGEIPKVEGSIYAKLPQHRALFTPFAIFKMRIYLPGQTKSIDFEADPRITMGIREQGLESAIMTHKSRVAALVAEFFRIHPDF